MDDMILRNMMILRNTVPGMDEHIGSATMPGVPGRCFLPTIWPAPA